MLITNTKTGSDESFSPESIQYFTFFRSLRLLSEDGANLRFSFEDETDYAGFLRRLEVESFAAFVEDLSTQVESSNSSDLSFTTVSTELLEEGEYCAYITNHA